MSIVNHKLVEKVIYWLLNIISPTINAQAIVTYSIPGDATSIAGDATSIP
ncbi:unnamed protein product, partial [Rotaria sp. Silwood1]